MFFSSGQTIRSHREVHLKPTSSGGLLIMRLTLQGNFLFSGSCSDVSGWAKYWRSNYHAGRHAQLPPSAGAGPRQDLRKRHRPGQISYFSSKSYLAFAGKHTDLWKRNNLDGPKAQKHLHSCRNWMISTHKYFQFSSRPSAASSNWN